MIKNFILNFYEKNRDSQFFCVLEILFHYFFLYFFVKAIYGERHGTIIAAAVVVLGLLRIKKYNVLWLISLLSWLSIPFLWQYENQLKYFLNDYLGYVYLFRLGIIFLIYCIAMILLSRNSHKILLIYMVFNICLYAIFYSSSEQLNIYINFGRYFISVYKYFIVPISYGIFYKPAELCSFYTKIKKISLLLPAWNLRPVIPISYASDIDQYDNQLNVKDLKKSLQSSSYLIVLTTVCLAVLILVKFFFYQNQFFNYYNLSIKNEYLDWSFFKISELSTGYEKAFEINQKVYQKWISILLSFINMYAQIVLMLNISVILARACGYQMKSTFNQPWLASTASQFYGKILYYYNHALMNLFVVPINESLLIIKNKLVRFYLSLFFGILIGGFYFHLFVRDFQRIFKTSFVSTIYSYLPTLCYFFVISLIVTLSYMPLFNFLPNTWGRLPRWIKIIFYFVVWSLVYNLYVATYHAKASLAQYIDYILGLFQFNFFN